MREWFIRTDGGATIALQFGEPGDVPVPRDYFGYGRVQIAVYRPRTSEWFLREDSGAAARLQWGGPGDQPVSVTVGP